MINFGIVGCGRISKRHTDLLGGNEIKDARLIAVCDIEKSKTTEYVSKYKINAYSDMHEMMKNESIDVVVVLTESGNHAKHVCELAEYGKNIIVEKPMALTIDDADEMIMACDRNNCKLFVIKQNRFNLPVVKLREAYEKGRFGKLYLGTVRIRWCRPQSYYDQDSWRGTWALDGGVITNQASHHIDLLNWMMGPIDSVFAKGIRASANIEAEDTAAIVLKFRNGSLGIIEATTAIRPKDLEGSMSILGNNGSVEIGGFAVNKILHWNFSEKLDEDETILKDFSVNPPNVYGFGHKEYYDHVIHCIQNNEKHLVDGLEGRKSVEIISAIYESMETKKEVFLRFKPEKCKLGNRL
jgi:UDP-N-acetyl-2-amino-2-deoxyglucuronate dehydrogenase